MTSHEFTIKKLRNGMELPGIGPQAVASLRQLCASPVPVVNKSGWRDRSMKPASLPHMGILISRGLAKLNPEDQHYHATNEGREWLEKLAKVLLESATLNRKSQYGNVR